MPKPRLRLLVIACLAAAAFGVSPVADGARTAHAATITLQQIAGGLSSPVDIQNAGDGSPRIFIVEQTGTIRIYNTGLGGVLPAPFLDVSSLIVSGGERGLLGLAFHPDYENNGYFYVDYTNTAGDTVIARYTVSANPNVANPASATTILTVAQPYLNHNGGQIRFGPDGYLYIAMGDGGDAGDPQNRAQNVNELLGKMLRIDVDSASPYASPPTNPLYGATPGRDEIWAIGLRNPWRFSFDKLTGDIFIADVGQNSREEVDFQAAGDTAMKNYGWRLMEGDLCYNPTMNCNPGGLTAPILVYPHSLGTCSITGGFRYRGSSAFLYGKYLYGDYCTGEISAATQGTPWTTSEVFDAPFNISTFGEDESGEVYVAEHSPGDTDGAVYRIVGPENGDGDTVFDLVDNCPFDSNSGQENNDRGVTTSLYLGSSTGDYSNPSADLAGDACDTDDDNDGLTDAEEISGYHVQLVDFGLASAHWQCNTLASGLGTPVGEAFGNTNAHLDPDIDNDGARDGWECDLGSDPTNTLTPSVSGCFSGATSPCRVSVPERCTTLGPAWLYVTDGDEDRDGIGDAAEGCPTLDADGDLYHDALEDPSWLGNADKDGDSGAGPALRDGVEAAYIGSAAALLDADGDSCPDSVEALDIGGGLASDVDWRISATDAGIIYAAANYNTRAGVGTSYNPVFDINHDSRISGTDAGILYTALFYNRRCSEFALWP